MLEDPMNHLSDDTKNDCGMKGRQCAVREQQAVMDDSKKTASSPIQCYGGVATTVDTTTSTSASSRSTSNKRYYRDQAPMSGLMERRSSQQVEKRGSECSSISSVNQHLPRRAWNRSKPKLKPLKKRFRDEEVIYKLGINLHTLYSASNQGIGGAYGRNMETGLRSLRSQSQAERMFANLFSRMMLHTRAKRLSYVASIPSKSSKYSEIEWKKAKLPTVLQFPNSLIKNVKVETGAWKHSVKQKPVIRVRISLDTERCSFTEQDVLENLNATTTMELHSYFAAACRDEYQKMPCLRDTQAVEYPCFLGGEVFYKHAFYQGKQTEPSNPQTCEPGLFDEYDPDTSFQTSTLKRCCFALDSSGEARDVVFQDCVSTSVSKGNMTMNESELIVSMTSLELPEVPPNVRNSKCVRTRLLSHTGFVINSFRKQSSGQSISAVSCTHSVDSITFVLQADFQSLSFYEKMMGQEKLAARLASVILTPFLLGLGQKWNQTQGAAGKLCSDEYMKPETDSCSVASFGSKMKGQGGFGRFSRLGTLVNLKRGFQSVFAKNKRSKQSQPEEFNAVKALENQMQLMKFGVKSSNLDSKQRMELANFEKLNLNTASTYAKSSSPIQLEVPINLQFRTTKTIAKVGVRNQAAAETAREAATHPVLREPFSTSIPVTEADSVQCLGNKLTPLECSLTPNSSGMNESLLSVTEQHTAPNMDQLSKEIVDETFAEGNEEIAQRMYSIMKF